MKQKIIGFHLDSEKHWTADLACGHKQHVRHDPPLVKREWVLSEKGRAHHLGEMLNCKRCDEVGLVVGKEIIEKVKKTIQAAHMEAGLAGMCEEGKLDYILDQISSMNIEEISQNAIVKNTSNLGTLT